MVLFELCSGQTLFSQDISNDELITHEDKTRLCMWNVMTDAELGPVLSSASVNFGDHFENHFSPTVRRQMFEELDVDHSGFLDLAEMGELAKAMKLLCEVVAGRRRVLGKKHPGTRQAVKNLRRVSGMLDARKTILRR